jgi:divalent metal cation (Fe/Co/Zn/Cd) transporter
MKSLLIGEAASDADLAAIRSAMEADDGVRRLIHMRTQHIGPDELLVGAKLELVPDLSVTEAAEAVDRIEASVRRAVPAARIMYLEPDVFRTRVPAGAGQPAHLGGTAGPAASEPEPAAETT